MVRSPQEPRGPSAALAETARQLGPSWTTDAVAAALSQLRQDGIELDPAKEVPATLLAVIRAGDIEPPADPVADVLILDQEAINESGVEPVGHDPLSPRGVDSIVRELEAGPATITGPEPHWCIQALVSTAGDYVHVEILDPVYWGRGPALPPEHLVVARELGFEQEESMCVVKVPLDEDGDLRPAAELIETFIARAWE